MRVQSELRKATVENARAVAKHLKIEETKVKDKPKISIIKKIGQVIEQQLVCVLEEEKVSYLQAVVQHLVDIPPPLENAANSKDTDKSELLNLKKEIEALIQMHEQKMKETLAKVEGKVKQETEGTSSIPSLIKSTSVFQPFL